MKALFLLCLVVGFAYCTVAQSTSPRALTKKIAPPPAPPASSGTAPTAHAPGQPAATKRVAPPMREKTQGEKDALTKKTVEFQKGRAQSGSSSAQYDLGVRYLNGDGVEKDLVEARKWLDAAALQGNSMAIQKLEALAKKK